MVYCFELIRVTISFSGINYNKTENAAKYGTFAFLVHWPRENVNIYILTQRATLISCNNPLPKVETAHFVFFAVY